MQIINKEILAIRLFILNAIFPTVPSLNLAVFLFLILAGACAYAEVFFSFVQSPLFIPLMFGVDIPVNTITTIVGTFTTAFFLVLIVGAFGSAVVALLLGKLDPETDVNLKQSRGNLRGFPFVLYILSAYGTYIGLHPAGDPNSYIMFATGFGVLATLFFSAYIGDMVSLQEKRASYTDAEALISVLLAGVAFYYYAFIYNTQPYVAIFSAYLVFATVAGIYRGVVRVFSPSSQYPVR